MITITFLQEKGGTGKTTLATHVAAGLAILGKRVLLIDGDGQGHATRMFGIGLMPGLYNLLVRRAPWTEVLQIINPAIYQFPAASEPSAQGMLAVLPGNNETMLIPMATSDSLVLARRLRELEKTFDVAIVDTSPTPSLLNGSILFASDGVIYPTEAEYFSLKALESSLANTESFANERAQRGMPATRPLGIIPMMVRANTVEHSENLKILRERYGDRRPNDGSWLDRQGDLLWPYMPLRITWPEATMQRRSIFAYAPDTEAASEMWQIVNRVAEVCQHEQA